MACKRSRVQLPYAPPSPLNPLKCRHLWRHNRPKPRFWYKIWYKTEGFSLVKVACRHLYKTGRSYCFRYAIPERLRPHFGRREIKKTLRTGNLTEAITLAEQLSRHFEAAFGRLSGGLCTMGMSVNEKIRLLVATFTRDVLKTYEDWLLLAEYTPETIPKHQAQCDEWIRETSRQLTANDYSVISQELREWLPPQDTAIFQEGELDPESFEYDRLCRECLKAKIQCLKIRRERIAGNYDNPYDHAAEDILGAARHLQHPKPPGDTVVASGMTLGEAVEAFVKEKMTGKRWSAKTETIARGVFRLLTEEFGDDAALGAISYAKLAAFRDDVMAKLPANRGKFSDYEGKTARQIVAMPHVTPMSHSTLQKNMVWIGSLFKWAAKHDYVQKNPAEGLRPADTKRHSASSERDSFSKAELQTMVTALEAERAARPSRPERYWVPLISMLNGMRLDEICQLDTEDVKQVGAVWCFDVNAKGDDKHLKTAASVRTIPIHPKLLELGFLAHVDALRKKGEKRLWPRLKLRRDGYGQALSKWFADFNDAHVTADTKKVFHSLRHSFATELKAANVQESTIAELVGHENPSITTGRYGKRLEPDRLLDELKKLDYGITFSVKPDAAEATE